MLMIGPDPRCTRGGDGAQTRQGAPALIRTMQNDKCRARAKSGPLMAIMTLLRPGGTAQGLGGGFRWGQRPL